MPPAPIFIVGLPRSGTTLLAAMLARHPAIDCGPETFFFARLPQDPARLVDATRWPGEAVDYLCSLRLRDAPVHRLFGRSRADIERDLSARPPSLAAILEALTAARASAAGKSRWAEKTPRHLAHLDLIRRTFPDAAVVRLVRDPRDTALSLARVPFASDSVLVNLHSVGRADAAAEPQVKRHPWLLTVRFEDLVTDPEPVLRAVCDLAAEPFDARMLVPTDEAELLAADHEWWKGKESQGLDRSRVGVWRRDLDPVDQRVAAIVCSEMIERHGYEGATKPAAAIALEPDAVGFVERQEAVTRRLALGGVVVRPRHGGGGQGEQGIGPARGGGLPLVFWPADGHDPWRLGRSRARRARSVMRMAALLTGSRLAGRPATRVVTDRRPEPGLAAKAAEALLWSLARSRTEQSWLDEVGAAPAEALRPLTGPGEATAAAAPTVR
ncbi:hypothetical protein BH18CHL1_BH18CHL1_09620 [soil metagenome]